MWYQRKHTLDLPQTGAILSTPVISEIGRTTRVEADPTYSPPADLLPARTFPLFHEYSQNIAHGPSSQSLCHSVASPHISMVAYSDGLERLFQSSSGPAQSSGFLL